MSIILGITACIFLLICFWICRDHTHEKLEQSEFELETKEVKRTPYTSSEDDSYFENRKTSGKGKASNMLRFFCFFPC